MTFDTDWDIEKYKHEHELEHHWELKKKFILTYKEKFPEDQLVSLSQTFYNMEVLGCRYDAPVMQRIKLLTQGMCTDRLAKEKDKFQRGFVPASNAATERVKAKFNRPTEAPLIHKKDDAMKPMDFISGGSLNTIRTSGGQLQGQAVKRGSDNSDGPAPKFARQVSETGGNSQTSSEHQGKAWLSRVDPRAVMNSGPFGKVVIFEAVGQDQPVSTVDRTASACHMVTDFSFSSIRNEVACKFSLNGLFLAQGTGSSQKLAKEAACRIALERLRQTSFTVQVKTAFSSSSQVNRSLENKTGTRVVLEASSLDKPIADSNIGSKMLKLMGWCGGGLGKEQQGLEEPISVNNHSVSRSGLGAGGGLEGFRAKARHLLEDFAHSSNKEDLVFAPDFTKDERKIIHEMVRRYNLKSRSYGKESEDKRHLVVFKKISPLEIIEELMHCGGETGKYSLIPPSEFL